MEFFSCSAGQVRVKVGGVFITNIHFIDITQVFSNSSENTNRFCRE